MTPDRAATGTAGRHVKDLASFDLGHEHGMHPQPEGRQDTGVATTTSLSTWLGLTCTTCRHTFRVGDQVLLDGSEVKHLDPALSCGATAAGEPDGDDVRDYACGLLDAWPAASGVPMQLTAESWQVAHRDGNLPPVTCPVCAHTFRPGDLVIICPCSDPADPPQARRCQLTIHRDPVSGLTCWDDWRPDGRLDRCPITREPPQ
jgi:hypothetical protein